MSTVHELFEKISHPTRVKILRLLEATPLNFSQIKSRLGIESSGNVEHHLRKLEGLVYLDSDGLYKITNDGKMVRNIIKSVELSMAVKKIFPTIQSRKVFIVFLVILAAFQIAIFIVFFLPLSADVGFQPLIGGFIGSIIGALGAIFGLGGTIIADSRSRRHITYFPSQKAPWMIADWVANLLFFAGYLTLLLSLIYAQIFSTNFPNKPLWYAASILALSTLFITSITISYRIIEKANKKIETTAAEL